MDSVTLKTFFNLNNSIILSGPAQVPLKQLVWAHFQASQRLEVSQSLWSTCFRISQQHFKLQAHKKNAVYRWPVNSFYIPKKYSPIPQILTKWWKCFVPAKWKAIPQFLAVTSQDTRKSKNTEHPAGIRAVHVGYGRISIRVEKVKIYMNCIFLEC